MKSPLDYNKKNAIYINESGLFALIFGSKKKESKMFEKIICSEVVYHPSGNTELTSRKKRLSSDSA